MAAAGIAGLRLYFARWYLCDGQSAGIEEINCGATDGRWSGVEGKGQAGFDPEKQQAEKVNFYRTFNPILSIGHEGGRSPWTGLRHTR